MRARRGRRRRRPRRIFERGGGEWRQRATETEFTLDTAAELAAARSGAAAIRGRSPWYLAWRRLRRNYVAFVFLGLFVLDRRRAALLAPVYAQHVAHTGPNATHVREHGQGERHRRPGRLAGRQSIKNGNRASCTGRRRSRSARRGSARGGKFVLGADAIGRDVAVRLLYGGRNSLLVGIGSSVICIVLRGHPRAARRLLRRLDRLRDHALLRPHLCVPGHPARDRARLRARDQRLPPLRDQHRRAAASGSRRSSSRTSSSRTSADRCAARCSSLREKEFVEAAIAQGASPLRDHVQRAAAEHRELGARLLHADHREQHPRSRRRSRSSAPASSRRRRRGGR